MGPLQGKETWLATDDHSLVRNLLPSFVSLSSLLLLLLALGYLNEIELFASLLCSIRAYTLIPTRKDTPNYNASNPSYPIEC